jgi:uncharacterized protein with PIN domain
MSGPGRRTKVMDLDARLDGRVAQLSSELGALVAAREVYLKQEADLEAKIETETTLAANLEKVSVLLNSIGEQRQADAQKLIENIVTQGLQTIFDPALSFHVVPSLHGKTAGIEFLVRTDLGGSAIETSVLDARGGGVAAVIGFLLRATVLLLSPPSATERVLVLDETFAHVSAEYLEPLGQFLRTLVDRTGLQIIMVTHQDALREHADRVYQFSSENGRTVVR